MREIERFYREDGLFNRRAWRRDIEERLISDWCGVENGVTTDEICRLYYEEVTLEWKLGINQVMQEARADLLDRETGVIVRSHGSPPRWYAVPAEQPEQVTGFLGDRSRRHVRSGERLQQYAEVGQKTYALPPGSKLMRAIKSAQPLLVPLAEASGLRLPVPNKKKKGQDDSSP